LTVGNPRILLVGDSLALGGTEGQFTAIAVGLSRSRWDVDVSCLRAEGPLRTKLESAGVRAWSCGRGSLKSPRLLLAVSALARYLRTHRILLVHSFDFYSNILGVLAARIARVPVVIASQRDLGDLRPPFQRRVHQSVLRLADYILVNSEAVAERIEPHRAAGLGRIVVIPNGVDAARFSPGGRRRSPAGAVTVGTLANLRPEKGLSDFMRAAALVRERCDARFVVWGDGPLRSDLEHLVRALGLDGAIELRGRTTEPELALRELDIFVLTSLSEACSNVLLEAMATGLAVVATRVGGNPELVEDEVTGVLTPPADPAGLAKAILRLIEQPAVVERLGARARERMRTEFSIERMLDRIQLCYEQALSASGS
jgi:glycosyltransferase involved in cell wall biosynthesis